MSGNLRPRLIRTLVKLDGASERLANVGVRWAPWPVLFGMSLAVTGWTLTHPNRRVQLDTNKLTEPERLWMLAGVGAAVFGVLLLYFLVMLVRRARTGEWRFLETVGWLNRALLPLLALPFIAALSLPNIEKDSPKTTLALTAAAAAATAAGVYFWGRSRRLDHQAEPAGPGALTKAARRLASLAVLGLWAGYGFFFSRLSITNHHALNTRTTDLGYYDNIFYQSIHGRPLGCSFIKAGYHGSAHFDPLLVLLSPLYLIYPRAEFLLVLQSVWLGAGVVPVYLLAKEKLGHCGKALLLAAMWAIYPALHGANMYEFHSLTLVSPLIVWLLYFYETGRHTLYWAILPVLLLCREDIPLMLCFVGLYALLDQRPGKTRIGWITIAVSLVYFAIVKLFFMTSAGIFMSGKDAYSYAYYYAALIPNRNGLGGFITSLLTNPVFALRTALEEPKIIFLLQLFLPLCFLPLLAKPGRWMFGFGFIFCLLASRTAVYSIHFQYSATIIPVAFALTPIALRRIEDSSRIASLGLDGRRLARALLAAAAVSSVLISWKFGGIVENATFRGGFARVTRSLTPAQRETYAWVREQVEKIPPGAIVGATPKMGPHISNRKEAYFYPGDRFASLQYAFIDEAELKGKDLEKHKAAMKRGEFTELARLKKMVLLKRALPHVRTPKAPPPKAPAVPSTGAPPPELEEPNDKAEGGAPPEPPSEAEQDEDPPFGP